MRNPSRRHSSASPMTRAARFFVAPFLAVGLLSGCLATVNPNATDPPTAAPLPEATEASPIFASNEEALAAALEAYAAYTKASDGFVTNEIDRNDLSVFETLVSPRYLPDILDGLESFSKSGRRGMGKSEFDTASIVSYADVTDGKAEVDLYLCSDYSAIRVFDANGVDVTPPDRPDRVPLQVGFVSKVSDPTKLLIDREDSWRGQDFCH